MSYDPDCEALAKCFIEDFIPDDDVPFDRPKAIHALAQYIQDAVENWLSDFEAGLARGEEHTP
jgi:hypothetical protein